MAYPSALNTDKFLTGGVMDAPDLQTRTAMNKLAWGMPISAQEAKRITQRQGLEQQSINVAQDAAQKQALLGMRDVNVGSYAGSMWSPPGSYTAARPIAQPSGGFSAEATADKLLKQRFGEMQPGSLQIAYGGSREGQSETIPAEMMVPAQSSVPSAASVPATQTAIPQAPALSSILGMGAGMAARVPQAGGVSSSAQQILGVQQQYAPQGFQAPVGSALGAMTPNQMNLAQQQQHLAFQQQEFGARQTQESRKNAVSYVASLLASGQPLPQNMNIPQDVMSLAVVEANEMKKKGQYSQEFVDPATGQVYKKTFTPGESAQTIPVYPSSGSPELQGKAEAEKTRAAEAEKTIAATYNQILSGVEKHTVAMDETRRARELISQGGMQGAGAKGKLQVMQAVNAVFPNTFDTSKTEA